MSDLNGINSQNSKAVIRAKIYSGILREQLEPELIAMNYVDVINSFPDGDKWEDVEMGAATVTDYHEGEEIDFKGLDFSTRTFEINEYVNSGHYVTAKFSQDSYLASQIMAKVPALEARAIAADLEQKILNLAVKEHSIVKPNNATVLNGMQHRFVAGSTEDGWGVLTPEDFAYATVALNKVNYHGPRIAIVPSYQEYAIVTNPRIKASLKYNPSFEGIVREGAMTGMKFSFNIYGWDVYTSEFLPKSTESGLKDREGAQSFSALTNCGVALLFTNITDRRPFRMAWRQMPKFEGRWNMAKQREEYVTIARYGIDVGDQENLVVILCKDTDSTITASA
jgi:hypothetical protein